MSLSVNRPTCEFEGLVEVWAENCVGTPAGKDSTLKHESTFNKKVLYPAR